MKRLLIVVVLAIVVAALFFLLWPRKPREQQVCERLVTLCAIEKVSPQACTDGLIRAKKMLGKDELAAAEDCVLQAKSCALASICLADKGLAALTPLVESLLSASVGSAKQLASRLVTELQLRSTSLGNEAKRVVSELSSKLSGGKQQLATSLQKTRQTVDSSKDALANRARQAGDALSDAQKKAREQIAAEINAAEAKVQTAHANAKKWVSDTIDSVGQRARRVGDTVAQQARKLLGGEEGKDGGGSADKAASSNANDSVVNTLEQNLAEAKALVASERFKEARERLEKLRWPGGDTERDKQLGAYYQAIQKALIKIIDHHREH